MNILGLSFDYHDAAAALVCGEAVIAAAQEERFTRHKNDPGFPQHAARFCLEQAGIAADRLDWVVHYERPMLKFDRVLHTALRSPRRARGALRDTLVDWFAGRKFEVKERIVAELGVPAAKVRFAEHHRSHAAAAFFCSPFERAAIVTLDGVGEHETATISIGEGTRIRKLASVRYPHSLGLFYSAFTAFAGFEVNEGEYKLMGMAGFGRPRHAGDLQRLFRLRRDGGFRLRQQLFDFLFPEQMPFTAALTDWLGPPREPDAPFDPRGDPNHPAVARSRSIADVAASAQKCTEEVMLHVVSRAIARTGLQNVCMAGGVALNSVANGRIQRELGCRLYVQPAAGDAGSAIGAALYWRHAVLGQPRCGPLVSPYLGVEFDDATVCAALRAAYIDGARRYESDGGLVAAVAKRLAQGAVVGWFQGRAEWGPRALGARSILADPTGLDMQAVVNKKIKFRESFRPFAPSVLRERAAEFFELDPAPEPWTPEHFMLAVCPVRPEWRARVPAITHVDGSARVHLVERAVNPLYYDLIAAFAGLTGVPMLLNTSFNLAGEPIVNAPEDAIRTFQWSGLDCLVLGRYLIEKEDLLC